MPFARSQLLDRVKNKLSDDRGQIKAPVGTGYLICNAIVGRGELRCGGKNFLLLVSETGDFLAAHCRRCGATAVDMRKGADHERNEPTAD